MNIEDSFVANSITAAADIGPRAHDAIALVHKRHAVATTVKPATVCNDKAAHSPLPDLALRRMSHQLASSMSKLVDQFDTLLNQLADAETRCSERRDAVPSKAEAEKLRQQLIFGGYRLANDLRKVVHAQQHQALVPNLKPWASAPTTQAKGTGKSAVVIDVQEVLRSIKGKLRSN